MKNGKLFIALIVVGSCLSYAEEPFTPPSVSDSDYLLLEEQSPFTRTLNLSDSLILTGIARVDDEQVATLINKETKETYVVSSQINSQGWKMVELKSDLDLEKVAAKVSVGGGEVVTVRYSESQLKPGEAKPGAGNQVEARPEGGRPRGDGGKRKGPSPEMREKMSKLSEEQRNQLFDKMRKLREANPNMQREDMGKFMNKEMDSMLQRN